MKYYFLTLFIFFAFISCSNPEFTITNATSQKWHGGRPESGRGVNYRIEIQVNYASSELSFTYMWIDGLKYEVEVFKNPENKSDNSFAKGDKVYLEVNHTVRPDMQKLQETGEIVEIISGDISQAPQNFDGAALIEYKINNTLKYQIVPAFKELEALNYP